MQFMQYLTFKQSLEITGHGIEGQGTEMTFQVERTACAEATKARTDWQRPGL